MVIYEDYKGRGENKIEKAYSDQGFYITDGKNKYAEAYDLARLHKYYFETDEKIEEVEDGE